MLCRVYRLEIFKSKQKETAVCYCRLTEVQLNVVFDSGLGPLLPGRLLEKLRRCKGQKGIK